MFRRVELFRFVEGTQIDTQCRGNAPVVYNAGDGDETYVPYPLGRNAIESKSDLARASLEVTMSLANPVAQRYLSTMVDKVLTLTVFQQRNAGVSVIWKGRLAKVKLSNKKAFMVFESIFTSLRRFGLHARFQRTCRWSIYGPGCGVVKADFLFEDDLDDVDGASITMTDLSAFEDGWFSGGFVEDQTTNVLRYILSHTGNGLVLSRPFESLQAAFNTSGPGVVAVNLYPGCAMNEETCHTKFDNIRRHGGFRRIPNKNPMGGSSIV